MRARTILTTAFAFMASAACALAQAPAAPAQPAAEAPKAAPAQENFVYVQLTTSMGDIVLELNNEKAPISTENFLKYVDKKFYDGTIFHRVIKDFMIQGGGFDSAMKQKPTEKPIKNEWKNGLKNVKYSVSMARTSAADSATSQFFINSGDKNSFLDEPRDGAGYAVFGKVVGGMDVVDKIQSVATGIKQGMKDVPIETVEIKSTKRLTAEESAKFKK